MEARINRASHFLFGVSKDTLLWGAGILIGAIMLSVSFFMDPMDKEILIQSKVVSAEEKATAPVSNEDLSLSSMVAGSTGKSKQNSNAAEAAYIQNETEIELENGTPISLEDFNALCKIVYSEAGIEDIEGQIMIANVVLNRVESDIFPNGIQEVILQEGQFEPVTRGAYNYAAPSKMTKEAVMRALNGEDLSEGALYFQKSVSKVWDDHTYLFRHGGHSFYK